MSIAFDATPGGVFYASPGGVRNRPKPSYVSAGLAIWPWQGYGQKFDPSSQLFPAAIYNYVFAATLGGVYGGPTCPSLIGAYSEPGGDTQDSFLFAKTDNKSLYQTITYEMNWNSGTYIRSQAYHYKKFWINGYGQDTITVDAEVVTGTPVSTTYTGAGMFPYADFYVISAVQTTTDTVLTLRLGLGDNFNKQTPDLEVANCVITAILSDKIAYDTDILAACDAALVAMTQPPAPTTADRFDVVWPDTASTTQTTTNSSAIYRILAAYGVLTDGYGVPNGKNTGLPAAPGVGSLAIPQPGISYGWGPLPGNAMICAATQWLMGVYFELNCQPMDPVTWLLQPTIGLSAIVPADTTIVQDFNPTQSSILGHLGSDIPTIPYTPAYAPPYSPGGFGEIGIGFLPE